MLLCSSQVLFHHTIQGFGEDTEGVEVAIGNLFGKAAIPGDVPDTPPDEAGGSTTWASEDNRAAVTGVAVRV